MRLQIGSAFGIPVYLHWSFFLLPLWLIFTYPAEGSVPGLPVILTAMGLLFVCVVLHEFGHALMARRFGIRTQDVTLYPLGGVARLMRMSEKPVEEILIALAGPAVNVVLTIPLTAIVAIFVVMDPSFGLLKNTFAGQVAVAVWFLNAIMVPFNMLPAFPMDGGRVLRALLSLCVGHYPATRMAVGIGFGMAILMGLLGLFGIPHFVGPNYMLPVMAVFLIVAGQQELMIARMSERRRRYGYDEDEMEELPEVLPVRPRPPVIPMPPVPALMFQPKISVYTWDNQTGTWRAETSSPI